MKIYNGKVNSLSEELVILQLNNMTTGVKNEMKNSRKELKHHLFITIAPFSIAALSSALFKTPTPIVIGAAYVGSRAILNLIKEMRQESHNYVTSSNIVRFPNPSNPHSKKYTNDDFVRKEIKNNSEANKTTSSYSIPPFTFLKLDDVKNRLTFEYDILNKVYYLPTLKIKESEWEQIYSLFIRELPSPDQLDLLYEKLNKAIRLTIASCLIRKSPDIILRDFIITLPTLAKLDNYDFPYQKIATELSKLINSNNIIDFNTLLLKKHQKTL